MSERKPPIQMTVEPSPLTALKASVSPSGRIRVWTSDIGNSPDCHSSRNGFSRDDDRSQRPQGARLSAPKALFVSSNPIGDCVISSGVIREIARQLPGVQITVACGRPPAPFVRSAPNVERVIILDKKKAAGHWIDLWKQVRGTQWDMGVDIRGSA